MEATFTCLKNCEVSKKKRKLFVGLKKDCIFATFLERNGSVAQLNRASDYGSEGYRFESCRSHKRKRTTNLSSFVFYSQIFFQKTKKVQQPKSLHFKRFYVKIKALRRFFLSNRLLCKHRLFCQSLRRF